jgi:hypothetical protein
MIARKEKQWDDIIQLMIFGNKLKRKLLHNAGSGLGRKIKMVMDAFR